MIDQNSKEGKALQAAVQTELKKYLGAEYSDDVLPLYIVVMLAHGNEQPLVADNLDAFLGKDNALSFADWLFRHLAANPGRYDVQNAPAAVQEEPAPRAAEPPAALEASHEDPSRHKKRREKREKIEWKGELASKSSKGKDREREREHRGDDKRRRSGETGEHVERLSRSDRLDRALPSSLDRKERDRDRDREREHDREARQRGEMRDDREARRKERERHGERHGDKSRREDGRPEEPIPDRRRGRHHNSHDDQGGEAGVRGRGLVSSNMLRSKVVRKSRSRTPPKPIREDARPSVFDRLAPVDAEDTPQPRSSAAARGEPASGMGKMRMDSLPGPAAVVQPVEEEESAADVQAELRRVQAQLAQLQKEKSISAVGRSVVVHNVHFNATSAILTAHFSGCGPIASVTIDRDPITGRPVGVATIEFEETAGKQTALTLSGSALLERPITVYAKGAAPPYIPAPFNSYASPAPFAPSGFGRGGFASRGRGGPPFGPGRGPGRGAGRGTPRPILMRNKYVRPKDAEKPAENGAAPAAVNVGSG